MDGVRRRAGGGRKAGGGIADGDGGVSWRSGVWDGSWGGGYL